MSEDNVQNENEMKGEICKEGNFLPKSEENAEFHNKGDTSILEEVKVETQSSPRNIRTMKEEMTTLSNSISHPIRRYLALLSMIISFFINSRQYIGSVPSTGLGTVFSPDDSTDQIYPACSLLLLGFFFLVPWVFGAFFMRSRNTTARTAGILCLILAISSILVYSIISIARRN